MKSDAADQTPPGPQPGYPQLPCCWEWPEGSEVRSGTLTRNPPHLCLWKTLVSPHGANKLLTEGWWELTAGSAWRGKGGRGRGAPGSLLTRKTNPRVPRETRGSTQPRSPGGLGPRHHSLSRPGGFLGPRGSSASSGGACWVPWRWGSSFGKTTLRPLSSFAGDNAGISVCPSPFLYEIRRPTVLILPFKNRFCGEPHL